MAKLTNTSPYYTIWCDGRNGGKYGKTYRSLAAARNRARELVTRDGIRKATIHTRTSYGTMAIESVDA